MTSKLTLRLRLIATMALLGLIIVAVGLIGINGMRSTQDSLEQVYSNQMLSSIALGN